MAVDCELCFRNGTCQSVEQSEVSSWSRKMLFIPRELTICIICIDDIKAVGICLQRWGSRIKIPQLGTDQCPSANEHPEKDKKICNDTKQASKHGKKETEETLIYEYEECGQSFSDKAKLNSYDSTVVQPYLCQNCEKTFATEQQLLRHQKTHSDTKPFTCETCGKSFRLKTMLQDHARIHSGEKPFRCEACGQSFTHRTSLKYHQKSKHDSTYLTERPFQCETCGMGFRQKNHLVDHRRIHSGEKPFACKHCPKTFNRHNTLAKHLRTHTGERPFKCNHCGKAFNASSHLISHIRTHTGEKPYICSTCGKSFSRKDNLKEHERTHSALLPFYCPGCGENFPRKKLLTQHSLQCRIQSNDSLSELKLITQPNFTLAHEQELQQQFQQQIQEPNSENLIASIPTLPQEHFIIPIAATDTFLATSSEVVNALKIQIL